MHVVYKLIFTKRKERNHKPYYYVGSKSNCSFEDNIIVENKTKRKYFGSSRYDGYQKIVQENIKNIKVDILFSSDNCSYKELIAKELLYQNKLDVVKNVEYFNLSLVQQNSFSEPGYALYRHRDYPQKRIRLKSGDPKILSGEYIHINKGKKRSASVIEKWKNDVARKPKSKEHRQKIGRSGLIMIKNAITHECLRIKKEDIHLYDPNDWYNPLTLSKSKLDETGRPIKKKLRNKKNTQCMVNNVCYESIKDVSEELNITRAIVKNRLNSKKWLSWKKI